LRVIDRFSRISHRLKLVRELSVLSKLFVQIFATFSSMLIRPS
jgi:hypothetical protein